MVWCGMMRYGVVWCGKFATQIFGHHEHEHGAEEGSSGVGPLGVLGAPLLASLDNLTTAMAA